MGDEKSHKAKAKHNEDFVAFIKKFDSPGKPNFPDWTVTAIFYVAVHIIDSKLAKTAPPPFNHPSVHAERNTAVSIYLKNISRYYFFLKNKSEFARYFVYSERRISQPMIKTCLDFLSKL